MAVVHTENFLVHPKMDHPPSLRNADLGNNDRVNAGEEPYHCTQCNRKYTFLSNLLRHMKSHYPRVKEHQCPKCSRTFGRTDHLNQHIKTHSEERPHICKECGRKFAQRRYLKKHERIHEAQRIESPWMNELSPVCQLEVDGRYDTHEGGEERDNGATEKIKMGQTLEGCSSSIRAFVRQERQSDQSRVKHHYCEICERSFASKQYLIYHKYSHSGEKPFACPKCPKRFNVPSTLKKHEEIHNPQRVKNFCCSECSKTFATKQDLGIHERVHTGEEPYHCTQCKRRFKFVSNLARHMLTHYPRVKEYHCPKCDRTFGRTDHLNRHLKTHSEQKHFVCKECGRKFARIDNLKQHERTHDAHRVESPMMIELSPVCHLEVEGRDGAEDACGEEGESSSVKGIQRVAAAIEGCSSSTQEFHSWQSSFETFLYRQTAHYYREGEHYSTL